MDQPDPEGTALLQMANVVFQTSDGEQIELIPYASSKESAQGLFGERTNACGLWFARLKGGEELPVFCRHEEDLRTAIDLMRLWPAEHERQRTHYMRLLESDGPKRFIYLGADMPEGDGQGSSSDQGGPSNGGQAETSRNTDHNQERDGLPEPIALERISTIRDLVKALNMCRLSDDKKRIESLRECVRKCKHEFEGTAFNISTEKGAVAVKEYSLLAEIRADSPDMPNNEDLLIEIFPGLCRMFEGERYRDKSLIEAISFTLCKVQKGVFKNDPDWLLEVGTSLLNKLTSTGNRHAEPYYKRNSFIFCALLRILVLLGRVDEGLWNLEKDKNLIDLFTSTFRKIDKASQHYATHYHVLVLEQSLVRLVSGQWIHQIPEQVYETLMGLTDLQQFVCLSFALYHFPFDVVFPGNHASKAETGIKRIRNAWGQKWIRRKDWYDWIMELNAVCAAHMVDKNCLPVRQCLEKINAKQKSMFHVWFLGDDRVAVRFAIVQQLCILVLESPSFETRKESLKDLLSLAFVWQEDGDVLKELLTGLVRISEKYQCQGGEKQAVQEALNALSISPGRGDFWHLQELVGQTGVVEMAVQEVRKSWYDNHERICNIGSNPTAEDEDKALEGILGKKVEFQPAVSHPSSSMWRKIMMESLGGEDALSTALIAENLKKHYTSDGFACIPSFLGDEENPKHVSSLRCQLMWFPPSKKDSSLKPSDDQLDNGKKQNQQKRVELDLNDLFGMTTTESGQKQCELKKVLVEGRAGTGKTTLSKMLAHKWAEGNWYEGVFDHLYVLPVRKLQEKDYNHSQATLDTAIANVCRDIRLLPRQKGGEDAYYMERELINKTLDSPRTLLVLDGLDEQFGVNRKMLNEAKLGERNHKLLVLSRQSGTASEESDRQVELMGFNIEQIKEYVNLEFNTGEQGKELLNVICKQPALESAVHVPLNLEILCHLWKDDSQRERVSVEIGKGSIPELYRLFCNYLWDRNEEKLEEQNLDGSRDEFFDNLGKIALSGQREFDEFFITDVLGKTKKSFQKTLACAGFLLNESYKNYRFAHETFQEYFAGRLLAKHLLSKEDSLSDERTEAEKFVCENKYDQEYRLMLSFMAGQMSNMRRINGMRHALMLVNREPKEILGVQHLLLQMQLVHEWLCVVRNGEDPGFTDLDGENGLVSSAKRFSLPCGCDLCNGKKQWFEYDVVLLLMRVLETSPTILVHAPEILRLILRGIPSPSNSFLLVVCGLFKCPGIVSEYWSYLVGGGETCKKEHHCAISLVDIWAFLLIKNHWNDGSDWDFVFERPSNELVTFEVAACLRDLDAPDVKPVLDRLGDLLKDVPGEVLEGVCSCLHVIASVGGDKNETILSWLTQISKKYWREPRSPVDLEIRFQDLKVPVFIMLPVCGVSTVLQFPENVMDALDSKDEDAKSKAMQLLPALHQSLTDVLSHSLRIEEEQAVLVTEEIENANVSSHGDALQALSDACGDGNKYLRILAISLTAEIVKADVSAAKDALQPLIEACSDDNKDVKMFAMWIIREVVKANGSTAEHALKALINASHDEVNAVKQQAIRFLGDVAKADGSIAKFALQALIHAYDDEDVRTIAIIATKYVAMAGVSAAQDALEALIKASRCGMKAVKEDAIYAIANIVMADGPTPEGALQALIDACRDDEEDLQCFALRVTGDVVKAVGSTAERALKALINASHDEVKAVKQRAINILGDVAKADGSTAKDALQAMINACCDEDKGVRRDAIVVARNVAKADVSTSQGALEALIKASRDKEKSVKQAAIFAIAEVVEAAGSTAQPALEALTEVCNGKDEDVRMLAMYFTRKEAEDFSLQAVLHPLIDGLHDENWKLKAFETLNKLSAEELMQFFLDTHDYENSGQKSALVPFLLERLYTEALVIVESNSNGFKRLRLHAFSRITIDWDRPAHVVDEVLELIKQHFGCRQK